MLSTGSKTYRTLQEQVGYNTEQIEAIKEIIDGLNVQDNVIVLATSTGTLSAEEMNVVGQRVAFIIYNAKVYIKSETSLTEYKFRRVDRIVENDTSSIVVSSDTITITISNGAYVQSVTTDAETYTTVKIDDLLLGKADLSGATFTGPIVAQTISQTQPNWEADIKSNLNSAIIKDGSKLYAKLVLLGNELSLVISGSFIAKAEANSYKAFISSQTLNIPNEIASKIYRADGTTLDQYAIASGFGPTITEFNYVRQNPSVASGTVIISSSLPKTISLLAYNFGTTNEDDECYVDIRVQLIII